MKRTIIIAAFLVGSFTYNAYGQIKTQAKVEPAIVNENPFLDASVYIKYDANVGKGLYFPQADLTTWEFKTDAINPNKFPTYFDGMIVYNTAKGKTVVDASKGGVQVDVEPGFYYFFNPGQKAPSGSINNGKWVRIGGAKTDYKMGVAQPTGEYFWVNATDKKPVQRQMLEVNFDNTTYADVTSASIPDDAVFLRSQLINNTGKVVVSSVDFRPNSGTDFGSEATDDYVVAKYGQISTTLNGKHKLIVEYYKNN